MQMVQEVKLDEFSIGETIEEKEIVEERYNYQERLKQIRWVANS